MRKWTICSILGLSILFIGSGCRKCQVCRSIGGPCGSYSIAGKYVNVSESTKSVPVESDEQNGSKPDLLDSSGQ